MSLTKNPSLPSASDFKTTYLSTRGAVGLAEHALSLPIGSPGRAIIQNLLHRQVNEGIAWDPDQPAPLTRDELIALVASADDTSAIEAVMSRLDVTEGDLAQYREDNDAETIMAEAA